MKYQLIKPTQNNLTVTQQILANRDIPQEDWDHYLNTTDDDINSYLYFGYNVIADAAAALATTISNQQDCLVVIDADCDGFTSSALLINYLYKISPTWVQQHVSWFIHDEKQHGLSDVINVHFKKHFSLIITPDSSSNDYEEHKQFKENGVTILVLDHHEADMIDPNAIIINNQLSDYPNKDFSGVGVTWQFCRYLDSLLHANYADDFLDLVALGNLADMMSFRSIETKHLILKGLKEENIKNPFIAAMRDKNSFKLGEHLTYMGVAFYIAPFVNAIVRSGDREEKELVFESMLSFKAFEYVPSTKRGHKLGEMEQKVQQAVRVVTNVKNRQTKAQDAGMERIEGMIKDLNLLNHKVLLFLMKPGEIDKNIAGLIANKIMAKYQRPCCILTRVEDENGVVYQGSARGCDKVGVNTFKDICAATGEIVFAAGHQGAFGLAIEESHIQSFIDKTDELLKDMADEAVYYVDFIKTPEELRTQSSLILDIADMEDLWGKDMDEPYIAIVNIKVTSDMVTIYRKTNNTLKITLPQTNISLMKFDASDEECDLLQTNNHGYVEIDVVGRCNKNEWNGNISPQIFIEDYQVKNRSEYFF